MSDSTPRQMPASTRDAGQSWLASHCIHRVRVWLITRRLAHVYDAMEFHCGMSISLAEQAMRLEREILMMHLQESQS